MKTAPFSFLALPLLFLFAFSSCTSVPEIAPDLFPDIVEEYPLDDHAWGDEDIDTLFPDDPLADDLLDEYIDDETVIDMLDDLVDDIVGDEAEPVLEPPGDTETVEEEAPAEVIVEEEPTPEELPVPLEDELPFEDEFPLEDELSLEIEPPLEDQFPEEPPLPELPPAPPVEPPPTPVQVPEAVIEPPPPVQPPAPAPVVTPPEQPPPPQQQRPEPPTPPSFLRPAEPEIVPPVRQQPPEPLTPPPVLPQQPRPDPIGEEIVFSRTVRATVGQIVEIPFWGTGWVYLGELGNRRGMSYSSRRLDVEAGVTIGQTFVFIAETAGTYILRFFRQDFIQDYLLHDYVQVIVGERREDTGSVGISARDRIIAEPRWPAAQGSAMAPVTQEENLQIFDPGPVQRENDALPEQAAGEITIVTPPPVQPRIESQVEFIRRARQEFDAGRVEQALIILDNMRQHYPHETDETLWLNAQLLEANSPSRDIRQALDYYHRLVREFPQSIRVPDARRRIAYLERFFFNIR